MLAAVVVLLDSAASAVAAALLVPGVPPVPVPHESRLPALAPLVAVQLPPALRVPVLVQAPPGRLLHLLFSRLPQVVGESEVPPHLRCQSF
jgi:hypothetical protein